MRIRGHEWRVIAEDGRWNLWGAARQGMACYALYLGPLVLYVHTRWEEVQAWLDAL